MKDDNLLIMVPEPDYIKFTYSPPRNDGDGWYMSLYVETKTKDGKGLRRAIKKIPGGKWGSLDGPMADNLDFTKREIKRLEKKYAFVEELAAEDLHDMLAAKKILVDFSLVYDYVTAELYDKQPPEDGIMADFGKIVNYRAGHISNRRYFLYVIDSYLTYHNYHRDNGRATHSMFKFVLDTFTTLIIDYLSDEFWQDNDDSDFFEIYQGRSAALYGLDMILTDDVSKYKDAKVPVMTPTEFLAKYPGIISGED